MKIVSRTNIRGRSGERFRAFLSRYGPFLAGVFLILSGNLVLLQAASGRGEFIGRPEADDGTSGGGGSDRDESFSVFGSSLVDAYRKNFFDHFRFRAIGMSITNDGFTEVMLRLPRNSRFRPFLSVYVALDKSGKIMRTKMHLKRRFIEDKMQSAFARDFAKSFVQASVPDGDLDKVRMLSNEIFFRQAITKVTDVKVSTDEPGDSAPTTKTIFKLGPGKLREGDIIIMGQGGELPSLPKKMSDLYKCFIGQSESARLELTNTVLRFHNEQVANEDTLVITVVSSGYDKAPEKPEVDFGDLPVRIPSIF